MDKKDFTFKPHSILFTYTIHDSALLTVIRILIILVPHILVNKSWYFTFISNFTENNSKKLHILKSVLYYVSFAKRKPHKNYNSESWNNCENELSFIKGLI